MVLSAVFGVIGLVLVNMYESYIHNVTFIDALLIESWKDNN